MFKNISKFGVMFLLLVATIIPVKVMAVEEATTTSNTESGAVQEVKSQDVTAEARAEKRQQRIDDAKVKATEKLTAAEERKTAGVCKSAQTIVEQLSSKVSKVIESRETRFSSATEKLNILSEKLELAGVDTTELNISIEQLQTQQTASSSLLGEYATYLTDISGMDCESDPVGFKALITTAREKRNEIKANSTNYRNYLDESVKPLLQTIRNELQNKQPEQEGGTN